MLRFHSFPELISRATGPRRIAYWGMIQLAPGFPMTEPSIQRLTNHYGVISGRMVELTQSFYDRLFQALPEVRPLFRIEIPIQSQHLAAALALIVRNLPVMDL